MNLYTYLVPIQTRILNGNLLITEESPLEAYMAYKDNLEKAHVEDVLSYEEFSKLQVNVNKGSTALIVDNKQHI